MPDASLTPYAHSLGIATTSQREDGAPVLELDFADLLEGRPGAMHGGAISGLLETAGYAALRARLSDDERDAQLKPVNITVQFLSAGKLKTSYACARIVRLGRRNANVSVEAWQDDRSKPIATAIMNILIVDKESDD